MFINCIPWDERLSACEVSKSDVLSVDLSGKVLVCHNLFASDSTCGAINCIGDLVKSSDLGLIDVKSSWLYSKEGAKCRECPVVGWCKGGCFVAPQEQRELNCPMLYSEYIPFFCATVEFLTGYIPYYIDGNIDDSMKSLFGRVDDAA